MKDYNVYIIEKEHSGMELGKYIKSVLMLSRRTIVKLKHSCAIKLNSESCWANTILREGDILEITLAEESSDNIIPEEMLLDIVYEDEYLIVINKPYGQPVHPTKGHLTGTLANGLIYYLMNNERSKVIRPVNRLDKNTTGLIVFAKNSHIQYLLSQCYTAEEFQKEYTAIVEGKLLSTAGIIDKPIAREYPEQIKRVVRADGDRAITHYELLESFNEGSILKILLKTGRTHQIRVHMSHIGHPLFGDTLYGGSTVLIQRHALNASRINMVHPITKQWIYLEAQLPDDMQELICTLRLKQLSPHQ